MPVLPLLLHDIFPSGDVVLLLFILLAGIDVGFAFIGVFLARRYGAGALAMSTVAFCLLVLIVSTTVSHDLGTAMLFLIMGGFAQAGIIAYRTRGGGGRAAPIEALIGGVAFIVGTFVPLIVASIVSA
jgi:hypothetical protein